MESLAVFRAIKRKCIEVEMQFFINSFWCIFWEV